MHRRVHRLAIDPKCSLVDHHSYRRKIRVQWGKTPLHPPKGEITKSLKSLRVQPLSGGFGLSVWCVRGDETLARLPLRAQDGCEGASFMACAHIEGGEVHSPSVAAIAGAFYASISLFEQDPSRIGFSFEPRL